MLRFNAKLLKKANRPYQFRQGGANPVSVHGVHFSTTGGLTQLDPGKFGSGSAGAEKRRLHGLPADDPILKRINFYVVQGDTLPRKEMTVYGRFLYEAQFSNLYDIAQDQEGLLANCNRDINSFEHSVIQAGYDGYKSPAPGDNGSIVLLGTGPVPVTDLGELTPEEANGRSPVSLQERRQPLGAHPPDNGVSPDPQTNTTPERVQNVGGKVE